MRRIHAIYSVTSTSYSKSYSVKKGWFQGEPHDLYIRHSLNAISLNLQVQISLFERETLLQESRLIQHNLNS